MAEFTMELNDEQKEVRDWLHGFSADVIRPAAAEWDEREETPWPVIQEAAKVGIYSLDFYAQQYFDPTGLGIPMAMEELFWGDAGIALSIVGTGLAAVGVLANGTEEQIGTWIPQMYGDANDVKVAAFCSSEPDAGSDVASMRTRAVYDEAKNEWVLNGTKTWATNGGIANVHVVVAVVDAELGSKGHASFIVPPNTPGLSQGQKFKKHGIRASHTAEVVLENVRIPGSCLLGGKQKLDERLARAHERAKSEASASRTRRWPRSRRAAPRWPRWRWALPGPPTRSPSTTRRPVSSSAARSSTTRGSPSSSPTCVRPSTRRGC